MIKTILHMLVITAIFLTGASHADAFKGTSLDRNQQFALIRQDIMKLHPETGKDVYILYDYIMKKKRTPKGTLNMEPIVAYVVAKKAVEHALKDNRMDKSMPRLSYFSLIVGIMQQESGFNPYAVSHANARGLMQVHVPTWKKHIEVDKVHDIEKNITYGTNIFYKYFSEQGGVAKALYKYYGAPDSKYAKSVLSHAVTFKGFYERNEEPARAYVLRMKNGSDQMIASAQH